MKRISLLLILLTGCADKLDKDLAVARQDLGKACAGMGAAATAREAAIASFAKQSFASSSASIERDWTAWIAEHTDSSGCLVSQHTNPDGTKTIGPMPVTQLVMEMTSRSDHLMNLAMAQKNFESQQAQYIALVNSFITSAADITKKDANAEAAKESAQAIFQKVLMTMGGIAAGAAAGAVAF